MPLRTPTRKATTWNTETTLSKKGVGVSKRKRKKPKVRKRKQKRRKAKGIK